MSEWKELRIKDFSIMGSGSTPKSTNEKYYVGGVHPWLNTADVQDCVISEPQNYITDLALQECNGLDFYPEDTVLLAMYGGGTIGNVGLMTFSSTLNQACCAMMVNKKRVLPKFLFYKLNAHKEEIISNGCGATQVNLSQGQIARFSFLFPDLEAQSRIVSYLDTKTSAIDSRISVLEQKRDAYGRLKKSIINDAVTHGLNPKVKMKDSGVDWIGEIPEHWEVKRFKEFAYTTKGKQTEYLDEQVEGSEIVLTVETLRQDIPTFFNYAIMPDKKQYCTTDDLVVIWDGAGVGELLRAKDGILSSTIAKVTVDEAKVLKEYLWLWRYKIEYTLKSIPTGMGIPHLNPTLLNNFMIPVPPLAEQKEIINVLSKQTEKLSDAITLLNAQIEKYKLLKRSLINEVITGQRAV